MYSYAFARGERSQKEKPHVRHVVFLTLPRANAKEIVVRKTRSERWRQPTLPLSEYHRLKEA